MLAQGRHGRLREVLTAMRARPPHHAQLGFSLVELMVGITIGLIVSAGAIFMAVNQINEHRRLTIETQIQQDLRTVSDVIHTDVRRAGYRGLSGYSMWAPAPSSAAASSPPLPNQFANISVANPNGSSSTILYQYYNPKDGNTSGPANGLPSAYVYGVKTASGAVYLQVGDGNWQPITDPATVEITNFQVSPRSDTVLLDDFCDKPCANPANCIQQTIRRYDFVLSGKAKTLKDLSRTVSFSERVKTDDISGACP
jgi:type IV pilus assembly protein PilW